MAATVSGNAGKVELNMPYVLKEKESDTGSHVCDSSGE